MMSKRQPVMKKCVSCKFSDFTLKHSCPDCNHKLVRVL